MNLFFQLLGGGIVNGVMFALLATGFGIVYRNVRIFHIAYGSIFVFAALFFHAIVTRADVGWWLAGLITVGVCGLCSCAMEVFFYRPFFLRGSAHGVVMVASLGLSIAIENVLALFFGNEIQTVPRELARPIMLGQVRLSEIQVWEFIICSLILGILMLATRLRIFRVIQAMGENEELLQVHGWPLFRYRALVFALSGAIAAVPACLVMVDVGLDVHSGMGYLLIAVVAVLVGGVNRMAGWVAGGGALAVLQSLVAWKFTSKWLDLVAFVLLIIVLLFRREGILGIHKRTEEL